MKRLVNVPMAMILLITSCASNPDNIEGRYVSPVIYQNWTCDQIVEERVRLSREVTRISGLQRENAHADAAMMTVGIVLLWPMLFGLAATKDRKDEVARLKGEYEAVDQAMRQKQCALPPPAAPQPASQQDSRLSTGISGAAFVITPQTFLQQEIPPLVTPIPGTIYSVNRFASPVGERRQCVYLSRAVQPTLPVVQDPILASGRETLIVIGEVCPTVRPESGTPFTKAESISAQGGVLIMAFIRTHGDRVRCTLGPETKSFACTHEEATSLKPSS